MVANMGAWNSSTAFLPWACVPRTFVKSASSLLPIRKSAAWGSSFNPMKLPHQTSGLFNFGWATPGEVTPEEVR